MLKVNFCILAFYTIYFLLILYFFLFLKKVGISKSLVIELSDVFDEFEEFDVEEDEVNDDVTVFLFLHASETIFSYPGIAERVLSSSFSNPVAITVI